MNISRAVSSHIGAVEFGFLSSQDIRKLSVKRITSINTFNSLLHPTSGGLYDPALGSFQNGQCTTCNLRQIDGCPGHCGHIELPLRVYHPTYIDQLLRLLRGKCVFCHHFRSSRIEINKYICKLRLINHGLIQEAEEIEAQVAMLMGKNNSATAKDSSDEDDDNSIINAQNRYVVRAIKKKRQQGKSELSDYTELASEARRTLIKNFMMEISKDRVCATCTGRSPGFRKERSVKIFMKALPQKKMTHNAQNDMKMVNPLAILSQRQKETRATNDKHDMNHSHTTTDVQYSIGHGDDFASDASGSQAADASDEDQEEEDMLRSAPAIDEEAEGTRNSKGNKPSVGPDTFLNANEVHAAIVLLFENEPEILRLIYNPKSKGKNIDRSAADMFFIDTILVPANRFRPENPGEGDSVTEHSRNTLFKAILTQCSNIYQIHQEISGKSAAAEGRRIRTEKDLKLSQIELQECVNGLIDKNSSKFAKSQRQADGIKQTLEKKEGLFRQNMMGKRVNFAGRSVISPDPNIETNEIGVPPVFATKLTYPEPVNSHNIWEMRQAVINGDKWPGAAAIETEDGKILSLLNKNKEERIAIANQLLTPGESKGGGATKKVLRHLNNGDVVIMNRQPTLHKPSMMCHRTRVLTGEKTLRMHYANCNTYNADFDGDEMNMHFPQNELARAEANLIADTDHQYLSATAGKPLRGLIQDHLSLCVHLTNKDSFFDRERYQQLIYAGLRPENGHTVSGTLKFLPPAIVKPKPLWTGKQIISTVLKNLTPEDKPGLYLESKSQTAGERWGDGFKDEALVLFDGGELMYGILDKKQIGPALGGVVHAVFETLGPSTAGRLLSTLGRLLTKLLHMNGFSCGVADIVLTPSGDEIRRTKLKDAATMGLEVAAKYVTLEKQNPKSDNQELLNRLEMVLRDDEKQKGLDDMTKAHSAGLSSEITKACLPDGLVKPWPKNQMQLMTGSGAKGSQVNANLISCNLGQQVLEGRRVPTMVSGKTLPCFKPFDSSLRAGGYIVDRFLTGVNPQEYYFHAMAGREGLIDTAVKTSRSGYLQRCLIKGMEGLKVEYDTSVRDSGDGSIIQFLYGEDGLDTGKSTYMNQFKFTAKNFMSLYEGLNAHEDYPRLMCEEARKHNKKAAKALQKNKTKSYDPATSIWNPARHAGSMSEKFYGAVTKYMDENKDGIIQNKKTGTGGINTKAFTILAEMQYMKALADPGEAVGIVAAQSVGEPSTQMTLNTFHLAGHSSKNVTLGIPRLREIVMTASANIMTPMMTLHLNPGISIEDGEKFAKSLSRLSLSEVVDQTKVIERLGKGMSYAQSKYYKVRFDFFPAAEYEEEYNIEVQQVLETIATQFLPSLSLKIAKEFKRRGSKVRQAAEGLSSLGQSAGRSEEQSTAARARNGGGGIDGDVSGDEDDEDAGAEDEMGADAAKMRNRRSEMDDYNDAQDQEDEELASQASDDILDDIEEDDRRNKDDATAGAEEDDDDEEASEGEDIDRENREQSDGRIYITESPENILHYVQGIKGNEQICAFTFDPRGAWCEATLEYSASQHKLLILSIVESCTRSAVIQAIPMIKSCILDKDNKYTDPVTDKETKEPAIVSEGCNLLHMREFVDYLNPNMMFTNDIAAMRKHYGVEAGRATIVREMHGVFKGHAIDVDFRHLNLIADCMTRSGGYVPFSRNGMKNAVSAFMKMSFETTLGVLKEAVAFEEVEDLRNPSARIVMGRLSTVGTGSFNLLLPTDLDGTAIRNEYDENDED